MSFQTVWLCWRPTNSVTS